MVTIHVQMVAGSSSFLLESRMNSAAYNCFGYYTCKTCRLTSQCNAMVYWQLGTNNHILCMGCRGHYCTLCRKRVLKSPGHYGPRGCQQHTDPWDSKSCCIQYITPLYRTSSPLPVFASTRCPKREGSCRRGQCKFAIRRFHGSILARRNFDVKNKWFAM